MRLIPPGLASALEGRSVWVVNFLEGAVGVRAERSKWQESETGLLVPEAEDRQAAAEQRA